MFSTISSFQVSYYYYVIIGFYLRFRGIAFQVQSLMTAHFCWVLLCVLPHGFASKKETVHRLGVSIWPLLSCYVVREEVFLILVILPHLIQMWRWSTFYTKRPQRKQATMQCHAQSRPWGKGGSWLTCPVSFLPLVFFFLFTQNRKGGGGGQGSTLGPSPRSATDTWS